ncbi:hypothetical protein QR680_017560 [Steinernema hermaphroditum]|uniref:EF-hand domain-containing protein n=1 Tax=Steinernema hermaphroditum TaxID=289476 RepID=A0AA39LPL4_9BILA|nr:hypothetical protein QR680_017560 [Steinernema hermaphroditum]
MFRASSEEQHGYPSIASASVTSSTNTGKELAAEKAGIATLSAQELAQTSSELFSKGDKKIAKHVTPLLKSSPKPTSLIQVHPHGLCPEKERALKELYERLDMDNDGTIDIRDLTAALKHEMPHIPYRLAPKLLARIRRREDDDAVNFSDFVHYVIEHEKRLELIFQDLDRNQDGYIDVREIKEYCHELGIPISDARAQNIVEKILCATENHPFGMQRLRMDQTGSAAIDLSEFQQFMLLYPSSDPRDIADFWRHNLVIDIGEDSQVPEDFSQSEIQSGVWWRHLVAGGVAGCFSRTCTAPLDRLKVFMQVYANKSNRMGLMSAVRMLHAEGGVRCFWRGNGINVIKIAPESAIKFMAYEQLKRVIQRLKGDGELTIYERFLAGSSAGAISQTAIYPMEVLKTRLALRRTGQLDHGVLHFAKKIPFACGACSSTCGQLASYPLALIRTRLQAKTVAKDRSQPDTMSGQFRFILKNEGVVGLYRGITPNFMKVIPAVSISYVVYETVRKHLGASMS